MAGEMHIGAMLRDIARRHGERTAIVDDAGAWTYRQFVARLTRFGNALRGLGLQRGDRVGLLLPDMREYLEADYGAMSAGFVRVPMDPQMSPPQLAQALRHAGARALVAHASFAEKIEPLRSDVEGLEIVIVIGGAMPGAHAYEGLLEKSSDQPFADGHGDELATLNFSGGTTSAPKAIMLRHRNMLTAAHGTIGGFDVRPDAVFLNVRPLWPIAQVIVMSYLMAGAKVVLGGRFDAANFAPLVKRSGATRTSLVPTQLVRILEHVQRDDPRLATLEAIHVGGSRIAPDVFERAVDLLGPRIGPLYGLTEAPIICYLPPKLLDADAARRRELMESTGAVLADYDVKLDTGSGEVMVRGGNVMAGYWRDEDTTRATLRDGWLHTGDIGRFDGDGNLYIVGRLKEVIRSGSRTIVPKEVEDVIARHPAVSEVAVLGLPDQEWGEAVTAFVVVRPGMAVSEGDVVAHCRAQLAAYKKPRAVRFVSSLPRSHYGKVLRAQLIADAGMTG
jgi:acyl-CoA synthetase (AMP-forming)/AMP-acid ligase II